MSEREIGVWICDCAGLLNEKVDFSQLHEKALSMENVKFVKRKSLLCSKSELDEMKDDLLNNPSIKSVLFAGCSPRTSLKFPEERITAIMSGASLSTDFLEVANIREQAAWISDSREEATLCAKDLMLMAHARLKSDKLATRKVPISGKSLVIGAGPAGLQAAKSLAALNHEVSLVETRSYLGGNLCKFPFLFQCEGWSGYCTSLCVGPVQAKDVVLDNNIECFTQSEVSNIHKNNGNFHAKISSSPKFVSEEKCISCGKCSEVCPESVFSQHEMGFFKRKAIDKEFERAVPDNFTIIDSACTRCGDCIEVCPTDAINLDAEAKVEEQTFGSVFVATGLGQNNLENNPEYSSNSLDDVISSLQFERLIAHGFKRPSNGEEPESVVFIQCAGSRATRDKEGEGVPYCSKTCCAVAVKQAERLATANQFVEITIVYYHDIRAYERALEALYNKTRDMGLDFLNGEVLSIARNDEDNLTLKVTKISCEEEDVKNENDGVIELEADLVVLAQPQMPEQSTVDLFRQLDVTMDKYGFPVENQPRIFRPSESFVDRLYVIGSSSGPKIVQEAVEQGSSAVARALPELESKSKLLSKYHSEINESSCSNCQICESVCPHGAISLTSEGIIKSDPAFCQACGLCQSVCPTHAAALLNLNETQVLEQAKVAFTHLPEGEPKILALLCYWCSYAGADLTGVKGLKVPLNFRSVRIRCSSSVAAGTIMKLLKLGIDGILIAGCPHSSCHHRWGNYLVDKRIVLLNSMFRQMGLSEKRVRFEYIGVPQSEIFVKTIESMVQSLRELGPNPLTNIENDYEAVGIQREVDHG